MAPAEKAGEEDDDDGGSHSSSDCHTLSPPDSSGTNLYRFHLDKKKRVAKRDYNVCICTLYRVSKKNRD